MRQRVIADTVRSLLEKNEISAPPVPVDRLVKSAGARIVLRSLEDRVSGFVLRHPGEGAIVGINSYHPFVRQRFTMAHELGHLLLHKNSKVHVDETDFNIKFRDHVSSGGSDRDEREANAFAAALLMPQAFLEHDMRNLGDIGLHDDRTLQWLAKRYGVSLQAMLIRLSSLRLIDPPFANV